MNETSERAGLYVKTYGCQMNEYDSEKVVALLSADYERVTSLDDAQLIFVNTCSVRANAENKLYSLIGRLRSLKAQNPELIIGVGGCVAQQEGTTIVKRNREVDFVVGTHNLSLIPSLISAVRDGRGPQVAIDYRDEWEDLPQAFAIPNQVRALVSIQRGCNKRCAFCVVPRTRGDEVSRSADEIERETRAKVRLGAKEVLLLGQTVNSYGRDLSPRYPFEKLIRRLAAIEGLERIRFTSPHPQEVRPGFIELYGDVEELCPHIHLPLQAGNDRVLKLMNRNYRKKRYLSIVESLRRRCPEIAISSDLIVGFPTETEAEFQETLEVMREVRYNSSYSFMYSRRPNTAAVEQFAENEEIPREIALDRLQRLQALQDELSAEANKKMLSKQVEVLVEGPSKHISSLMRGRIPQNTLVEVESGLPSQDEFANVGELVNVTINHAAVHGLRGRLVELG